MQIQNSSLHVYAPAQRLEISCKVDGLALLLLTWEEVQVLKVDRLSLNKSGEIKYEVDRAIRSGKDCGVVSDAYVRQSRCISCDTQGPEIRAKSDSEEARRAFP